MAIYPKTQQNLSTLTSVATPITNISSLRSIIPVDDKVIYLRGYYADGLGCGFFVGKSASSATDDGGSVIRVGSGAWLRIINNSIATVADFGVVPNIDNSTTAIANAAAINKAFAAVDTVTIPANYTFYVPLSCPTSSLTGSGSTTIQGSYNGIYIPNGKRLIGVNKYTSIVKAATTTSVTSTSCVIGCDSNTTISNLTVDGNKTNISGSGSWNTWLVRTTPVLRTNISCESLIVKNGKSSDSSQESFGISYNNTTNSEVRNCETYNIDGTGIHFDSDYINGVFASYLRAVNIRSHDNLFMGVSSYGSQNISIIDSAFYNNSIHGINVEWTSDAEVHNCKIYSNGGSGIGTYGANTNIRFYNCESVGNLTTSLTESSEIYISSGTWYTSLSGQTAPSGISYTVEIHNCKIIPSTGKKHIDCGYSSSPNTGGVSSAIAPALAEPYDIFVNCPNAEKWTFNTDGKSFPQGLRFGFLKLVNVRTGLDKLANWTVLGTTTTATLTDSNNPSTESITVTTTGTSSGLKTSVDNGRTYRARIKFQNSTAGNWYLTCDGGTTPPLIQYLNKLDTSTILKREFIFLVPNDGSSYFLSLRCNDASGSLNVYHLQLEEIESDYTSYLGLYNQLAGVNPITLKGADGTYTQLNDTSANLYIDIFPLSASSTAAVKLFQNSKVSGTGISDGQFVVYKPGTSTVQHTFSGNSDSFFNTNAGRLGVAIPGGYQGGCSEKFEINGIVKVRNISGSSGIKIGSPSTIICTAAVSSGATSLVVKTTNSASISVSSNALITFGSISATVTTSTLVTSSNTTLPVSAISGAIAANTTSSAFNPSQGSSDRWFFSIANTPANSGSGDDLSIFSYNDAGSYSSGGGAANTPHLYLNRGTSNVLVGSSTDNSKGDKLQVAGAIVAQGAAFGLTTKTSAYTATNTDRTILVNASSGAVTITLPSPSSVSNGKEYRIKKTDSSTNTVTVTASSGLIEGSASVSFMVQYQSLVLVSDGSNWFKF